MVIKKGNIVQENFPSTHKLYFFAKSSLKHGKLQMCCTENSCSVSTVQLRNLFASPVCRRQTKQYNLPEWTSERQVNTEVKYQISGGQKTEEKLVKTVTGWVITAHDKRKGGVGSEL